MEEPTRKFEYSLSPLNWPVFHSANLQHSEKGIKLESHTLMQQIKWSTARTEVEVHEAAVRLVMLYGLERVGLRRRQSWRSSSGVTTMDRIRNGSIGCFGDREKGQTEPDWTDTEEG